MKNCLKIGCMCFVVCGLGVWFIAPDDAKATKQAPIKLTVGGVVPDLDDIRAIAEESQGTDDPTVMHHMECDNPYGYGWNLASINCATYWFTGECSWCNQSQANCNGAQTACWIVCLRLMGDCDWEPEQWVECTDGCSDYICSQCECACDQIE